MKQVIRHIIHPEQRTSTLYFDDDSRGEYFLRGGIAFPFTECQGDRYRTEGYAVLCGYQVETEMRMLFEHRAFTTINHVVGEGGALVSDGLCSFFARCWSVYGARSYYSHDEGRLEQSYRIQISRAQQIVPKPVMLDLTWPQQPGAAEQVIGQLVAMKKLAGPASFAKELKSATAQGAGTPAKHALICALLGMEEHPWRKRPERDVDVVLI